MRLKKVGHLLRSEDENGEFFHGVVDLGLSGDVQILVYPTDKEGNDKIDNHAEIFILVEDWKDCLDKIIALKKEMQKE